ncbi:hypothetical protein DPEC_G00286490 [Dallia pectoralis]|uniref:Uncharacterized protein n=1 Tax=Dallia pectoralis TaxID=75939 RepID=A0ACC2FJY2_DALPE|nr:hypothetical protein DPEC_G00286490 [Dallia pectoralis]
MSGSSLPTKSSRAERFLVDEGNWYLNAIKIFKEIADRIIKAYEEEEYDNVISLFKYLDEFLHSIFCIGWIDKERIPQMIFKHLEARVEKIFPKPFEKYRTQLPKRTPFSCLLDVIVTLEEPKPEPEEDIKKTLQGIAMNLEGNKLVASTICSSKKKLGEMFGLETESKQKCPHGNCAEAESLSKLLYNENDVAKLVKVQEARGQVLEEVFLTPREKEHERTETKIEQGDKHSQPTSHWT